MPVHKLGNYLIGTKSAEIAQETTELLSKTTWHDFGAHGV